MSKLKIYANSILIPVIIGGAVGIVKGIFCGIFG